MPPTAETTQIILFGLELEFRMLITLFMFFAEPTEVPPNFKTFIRNKLIF